MDALRQCLLQIPQLELAILIGSQASGKAHANSDWDIAIRWHRQPEINVISILAQTETLRRTLARLLKVTEDKVDLIDLTNARLTMRAVVAEGGESLFSNNVIPGVLRGITRKYRYCYAFRRSQPSCFTL